MTDEALFPIFVLYAPDIVEFDFLDFLVSNVPHAKLIFILR